MNTDGAPQALTADLALPALLEALLFVADGPQSIPRLASVTGASNAAVQAALLELQEHYATRGLRLQRTRDQVQLTTAPAATPYLELMLGVGGRQRLSQAALETLAIVAYRQPVTRPQVDEIRGVNSDSVFQNLLGKGLVDEVGRADGPGRPVLYGTTPTFLQHFGLNELGEMPDLLVEPLIPGADGGQMELVEPAEDTLQPAPDSQPAS
ncbi:segregation and condensation protein B [Anaerolineae bacterium]|nr:segregation and condensation protein B [Chloroflexota bacterium]GBL38163.1 segregation and condensation protein B [Anaerolineaceae bacterium]GDX68064.1 segregation and condensation protein B [Anaerolineae bacterium]